MRKHISAVFITLLALALPGALCPGAAAGRTEELLAPEELPFAMSMSGGTLFWTDESGLPVRKVSASGGPVTALAADYGTFGSIGLSGNSLSWINASASRDQCGGTASRRAVMRSGLDGKNPAVIALSPECDSIYTGNVMTLDGSNVYWVVYDSSTFRNLIIRQPLDGSSPAALAGTSGNVHLLKQEGSYVYWSESGDIGNSYMTSIWRAPKTGGTPMMVVADSKMGSRFAIKLGKVYYATYSAGIASSYSLRRIPAAGGKSLLLATVNVATAPDIPDIASDGTEVFWTDGPNLLKVSVSGGQPLPLADGLNRVTAIDLTGTSVVWGEASGPAHGETGSVKSIPKAGGEVTVIASGIQGVYALDAGSGNVYWAESGPIADLEGYAKIRKAGLSGGGMNTLVFGVQGPAPIAAHGLSAFVANGFTLKKVPVGGTTMGTPEQLAISSNGISRVATDGVNVYWGDWFSAIFSVPVTGGEVTVLSGTLDSPPEKIAVAGGYVYWGDLDSIQRVSVGGGTVQTVAANLAAMTDFVVKGGYVYIFENDTGWIKKVRATGGIPAKFASSLPFMPTKLAADSQYLYWINPFSVNKVPLSGGAVETLKSLSPEPESSGGGCHIAVDSTSLYFTEENHRGIRKLTPK